MPTSFVLDDRAGEERRPVGIARWTENDEAVLKRRCRKTADHGNRSQTGGKRLVFRKPGTDRSDGSMTHGTIRHRACRHGKAPRRDRRRFRRARRGHDVRRLTGRAGLFIANPDRRGCRTFRGQSRQSRHFTDETVAAQDDGGRDGLQQQTADGSHKVTSCATKRSRPAESP